MERNDRRTGIIKSISGLMLCTVILKLLGFVRELLLSYFFGASGISDAYLISQTIPGTIFGLVGAGVSTCFIPMFYKTLADENLDKAFQFTNKILTLTLAFSTFVIAVILLFPQSIVKLFASGFSGETLYYASQFTRICILSLYFSSFMFVYEALLQAKKNYLISAMAGIVGNVCILLSIFLGAKVSIWIISIGSCAAIGIRMLVMVPTTQKLGFRPKPVFHWNDPHIKSFLVMMLPVLIGTSISDVNQLVDRTIASTLAVGAISSLTYANSMLQLAIGGVVQPFSTVIYPRITELVHFNKRDEAIAFLGKMMNILLLLLIPITFGIVVFSKPAISLLFERGAFNSEALQMTSEAFTFYGLGLCFMGVRELISRFFYACEDSKTPMINSSIGLVTNIVLNLVLSRLLGIKGLALATSLAALTTCVLLVISLKKATGESMFRIDIAELLKVLLASIIMTVVSYWVFYSLFPDNRVWFILSVVIAILVFIGICFVLKVESAVEAIELVKVLLHKGRGTDNTVSSHHDA